MMENKIILGDCIEEMRKMPDESVDAIITDPPAGISFMGKSWDTFDKEMFGKKGEEGENDLKVEKNFEILPRYSNADLLGFQEFIYQVMKECLRVLKSGGHIVVWAIPRTSHHTAMGIERAGFEIRDVIHHIFNTGFPKSYNIGKGIEGKIKLGSANWSDWKKMEGKEYENKTGYTKLQAEQGYRDDYTNTTPKDIDITTELGNKWKGWGTALKPATENWILARKPLSEKTVVEQVLKTGTGGLNIDGCRIPINSEVDDKRMGGNGSWDTSKTAEEIYEGGYKGERISSNPEGRFPANVIVQDDALNDGIMTKGEIGRAGRKSAMNYDASSYKVGVVTETGCKDIGSKSRYFDLDVWAEKNGILQIAKPSKSEKNAGLEGKRFNGIEIILNISDSNDVIWNGKITTQEENPAKQLEDMEISLKKAIEEFGIQNKGDLDLNIISFGKIILEKYLKDTKFITEMEINSITAQQISNWLLRCSIRENIQDVFSKMMDGGNLVVNVENSSTLAITIKEQSGFVLGAKPVAVKMQVKILEKENKCDHPTVKSIALMSWLIRLVTPKGGTVLDPFLGSGTTGCACAKLGYNFIGIEKEEEYVKIATARIKHYLEQSKL